MNRNSKHYSKKDRKGGGHVCVCGKPLSGTRIKAGKVNCFDCEREQSEIQKKSLFRRAV